MDKERLYPEIEKAEKAPDAYTLGGPNQDAIGAFGGLLYSFAQAQDLPPKGRDVIERVRKNYELLFSVGKFEGSGGWKNVAHMIRCDMACLKMIVNMHADKK